MPPEQPSYYDPMFPPYADLSSPGTRQRMYAPTVQGAEIAAIWMRTAPNTTDYNTFNNKAYGQLFNASTLAQAWNLVPNQVSGFTAPVRGTVAEAQWAAGIRTVQNIVPGRP